MQMLHFYKKVVFNVCRECNRRSFKSSATLNNFWERDDKGGYRDDRVFPPLKERLKDGFQQLKKEVALWSEEVKEKFEADPFLIYRPGEVDVIWQFGNEEALDKWIFTSDADNKEGYSKCSLTLTNQGKGLFSGEVCLRIPKDGKIKRTGYCNIRTIRARKSFKRETYLNWVAYNMLVMRVRGDGRSYMLNINSRGYYDITWNDMYHFVLYTRGGPYWQVARIPFSKFFLASKGRIQDRQSSIPLHKITSFGITAAERHAGSFALEIDYIGLEYDPNHSEEFAYEMYKTETNIAAT